MRTPRRGETDAQVNMLNNISKINYNLASDAVVNPATGAIVCRITLTNPSHPCKPLNVLGYEITTKSDPGQQFVHVPALQHTDIAQDVFGASITGEPFSIWAGPVSARVERGAPQGQDAHHGGSRPRSRWTTCSAISTRSMARRTSAKARSKPSFRSRTDEFALGKLDINAAARATSYSLFRRREDMESRRRPTTRSTISRSG